MSVGSRGNVEGRVGKIVGFNDFIEYLWDCLGMFISFMGIMFFWKFGKS